MLPFTREYICRQERRCNLQEGDMWSRWSNHFLPYTRDKFPSRSGPRCLAASSSPFFLFLCPGLSLSSLPVPCFLTQLLRCPVSPRIPPSSCFLLPTDENCGEVSLAKEELLWRSFCTADLFEEYRLRSLLIIYSFRIRKRIHIMVEIISVQMRKESSLTTRIGIKKRIRKTEDRKK